MLMTDHTAGGPHPTLGGVRAKAEQMGRDSEPISLLLTNTWTPPYPPPPYPCNNQGCNLKKPFEADQKPLKKGNLVAPLFGILAFFPSALQPVVTYTPFCNLYST
ncbi:unnamed protein product [Boreogadus saida]